MPNDQTPMRTSPEAPTRATQETRNWFDTIRPAANIWAQSNAALLTQLNETAKTMHLFSQSRLQANIDACRSLSSCRDPAELAGHQREFIENATAQYSEHAQNMSEQTVAIITAAAKHPAPDL